MSIQVASHVLLAALGSYWVYFTAAARRQQWTDAFEATKVPATVTFLLVAGALLILQSVVGVASTKVLCLKRFTVARATAAALVVFVAMILTWTWHADASSAFSENLMETFPPSKNRYNEKPAHVAALQKYVCQATLQYVCNDALTKTSLEHLLPLNEDKTENGYSTYGESFIRNATRDVLLQSPDPFISRGFRLFCRDVPRQVQAFGPAVALANQYKRACDVCALTPTPTTAPLPPWLCIEDKYVNFTVPIRTTQDCIRSLVPAAADPNMFYSISEPYVKIFQAITRWCYALAVTTTVGLFVAVVAIYLAHRDARVAADAYRATV